jgi:hypothetical protein
MQERGRLDAQGPEAGEVRGRAPGRTRTWRPPRCPPCFGVPGRRAAKETGLSLGWLPETCPWSVEQLLNEGFLPEISVSDNPDV